MVDMIPQPSGKLVLAFLILLGALWPVLIAVAQGIEAVGNEDPFNIIIVSPRELQEISGSGVVIATIQGEQGPTSVWFEVGTVLRIDLPTEAPFSASFDSLLLADDNYVLSVHACSEQGCSMQQVSIIVNNASVEAPAAPAEGNENAGEVQPTSDMGGTNENVEPPILPEEPPQAIEMVNVKGSNLFSALTLYDLNMSVAGSGTEYVDVAPGTYNARIDFFDSNISLALLDEMQIDSNAILLEIDNEIDVNAVEMPDSNTEWLRIIALKPNVSFSSGNASLPVPGNAGDFFACNDWAFAERKCNSAFEKLSRADSATVEPQLSAMPEAFAFSKYRAPEIIVPDFNADAFDENKLKPKKKAVGKTTMALKKNKQGFAANDSPAIEISLTDEEGGAVEMEIDATLTLPDGTEKAIGKERIKMVDAGQFTLSNFMPRSFRPGTYSLKVRATDGNTTIEQTESFEYGLIALNTKKSIYRPGETAEFEIVVLDRESYGVRGAEVTMAILLPSGSIETLSTTGGGVKETTTSGIYVSSLAVSAEGTYKVNAYARAAGIDTSIQTTFDVLQDYAFDIVRTTQTKVDPARQPISVQIGITSFKGQRNVDVREFVPAEFGIIAKKDIIATNDEGDSIVSTIDDPRVSVKENDDEKIIEWKNVELDAEGKAMLEYSYTMPDRKPWLYNLGPIEIASNENESFSEARSWMVAVDANPTTIFYYRASDDGNATEPMPNASASGDSFAMNNWLGFGMQDTAGSVAATHTNTSFSNAGNVNVAVASFTSRPLVAQSLSAGTWRLGGRFSESAGNDDLQLRAAIYGWNDSNDARGILVVAPTSQGEEFTGTTSRALAASGSAISFAKGDKLVAEIEFYGISPTSAAGTIYFGSGYDDSNVTAPAGIRIAGDLNTGVIGPANNSTKAISVAFDVNVLGSCRSYSCGDTNVMLRYCTISGTGCAHPFFDMNTASTSPLYVSTGAASRRDMVGDGLGADDTNFFVFSVIGTAEATYTIRAVIDSNWSVDVNYSNAEEHDVNVTISAAADYSFALALPSTGCTPGKGNLIGGVSCQKGYFETTDLSGNADENKVNPEGQIPKVPFFSYDNQSSTNSDLNITLDLNAALPATLKLKVSKDYNGWVWTCTGETDSNCLLVSTTPTNAGKVPYGIAGTQDLNLFLWADFIAATVGTTDRNVTSTGVSST